MPSCQVPAKFLPARSLPRSFGQVLARLCSYTPLKFPPAAPDLFLAGRVAVFFSVQIPAAFRIGFLSTFGRFWLPKGSPKWHQNLTFSSLFPLLVLAPLFDAQRHEKVPFLRGPNHESVWPGQCLLNVRPFGRKTTFCRKNAPFWEPK